MRVACWIVRIGSGTASDACLGLDNPDEYQRTHHRKWRIVAVEMRAMGIIAMVMLFVMLCATLVG
jgi:hypothetical protein